MKWVSSTSLAIAFIIVLAPLTHARAQSLDILEGKRTVKGVPVELTGGIRSSLIAFWSTRCSPCIKDIGVMNQLAGKRPNLTFVWVNALKDEDVSGFADSLENISFVYDPDSLIWKEFGPKLWGEVFSFSPAGELLWHGSTYEITEEILSSIEQGVVTERKKHRFAMEYSVQNDVGYGDSEFSAIPHDDGEELRLKHNTFSDLIKTLVNGAFGNDIRIVTLYEERAATPVSLRVRFRCAREDRREARARLLKMLCAGYDIGLTVGETREHGLQPVVLIDYGKFSW
jgi:hypothetical protein